MLFVTHDTAEAARLADRLVILVDGAVAQVGSPEAIAAAPTDGVVARLVGAGEHPASAERR